MTPLLQKEIRLLLPSFTVAALLTIVAAATAPANGDVGIVFPLVLFFVGAVIVALAPFGQEYSLGTLPAQLAQPITRPRLWAIKTGLTAAALLLTVTLFVAIAPGGPVVALAVAALTALAGGLWTTITFRQIGAAFLFAILTPYAIVSLLILFNPWCDNHGYCSQFLLKASLILYSVTGIFWSRRVFLRATETDVWNRKIAWPAWLKAPESTATKIVRRHRPWRALVMKELASYQMVFVLAGGLLVLHAASLVMRAMWGITRYGTGSTLESVPVVLWLFMPWVVGAMAIAEERKQGTLVSQLCLPAARYQQFAVKLAVALFLGFTLGAVIPLALEGLAHQWAGIPVPQFLEHRTGAMTMAASSASEVAWQWGMKALFLTLVSFLASSLARHTLEALIIAFVLPFLLAIPNLWVLEPAPIYSWIAADYSDLPSALSLLIGLTTAIGLAIAIVIRSFADYQAPVVSRRHWIISAGAVYLTLFFAGNAAAIAYHRPWERLMTLEPPHGPARLSGPVAPKLCGGRGLLFALLPDGRIWSARTFEGAAPTSGEFFTESGWTDLACGVPRWEDRDAVKFEQAAVRSDGSLWLFSARPARWGLRAVELDAPRRAGRDNDWKSVSTVNDLFLESKEGDFFAIDNSFVAFRKDGTAWTFGGYRGDTPKYLARYSHYQEHVLLAGQPATLEHEMGLPAIERCRVRRYWPSFSIVRAPTSVYEDWLTCVRSGPDFIAFAADGSLCAWRDAPDDSKLQQTRLLGPTSRPLWCFNIFPSG
jgi:hypothetical protein